VDLDGDGDNDILSGSYSRDSQPMAGLFQVLWRQPDGSFKKAAVLKGTDSEPLVIPADPEAIVDTVCTRPTAVDWDADGDLDLVVGNFAGAFYVFTGEGRGRFLTEPKQIATSEGPLKIEGAHSDPFPVDWDRDGDLDLLSGSDSGGVQWAENTASTGEAPALQPFRFLIKRSPQNRGDLRLGENDLTGPSYATRVWVDDLNGDGKLDLLVGDTVTLVSPVEGLTEEEFDKKRAEWKERNAEVSEAYRAAGNDETKLNEAAAKYQRLYAERSKFMNEERTGYVWLYLQK